jgi:hypothetical protein
LQPPPYRTLIRGGATLAGGGFLLSMTLPMEFRALGHSLLALGIIIGFAGFSRRSVDTQAASSLQSGADDMIATWAVTPDVWLKYVDGLSAENGGTGRMQAVRATIFMGLLMAAVWYFADDKSDFLATAIIMVPIMGLIIGLGVWWYRTHLARLRASEPRVTVTRSALAIGQDIVPWKLGVRPTNIGEYGLRSVELATTPLRRIRLELEFKIRGQVQTRWISIPAPPERDMEVDVLSALRKELGRR